jgi:tetratricopeptide (TPR) repeat protein
MQVLITILLIPVIISSCALFNKPAVDTTDWNAKGLILFNQKKYEEAIKCFDKAIEKTPKFKKESLNFKGLVLSDQKKYEEAIKCFDKSLEVDHNFSPTWDHKGRTLFKEGKYEEAIKCFDKALEINPRSERTKTARKEALKALGK